MDSSDDVFNILFLDEISAAPPSVQSAAYQIVLDHKVGEHKLPKNCVVICAGNRVTDHSVAYKMPKALANRVLHYEITSDFTALFGGHAFFKQFDEHLRALTVTHQEEGTSLVEVRHVILESIVNVLDGRLH